MDLCLGYKIIRDKEVDTCVLYSGLARGLERWVRHVKAERAKGKVLRLQPTGN